MDSLFYPTGVLVKVTVNKLNLVPNKKITHFTGVLRNYRSLGMSKPYVSVMFFYPLFAEFRGNLKDGAFLCSMFKAIFGNPRWDLRVVSDLKTVHMPCSQWRRTSDIPFQLGRIAADVNFYECCLLAGDLFIFLIFCTNEEGYPFETRTAYQRLVLLFFGDDWWFDSEWYRDNTSTILEWGNIFTISRLPFILP